MTTENQENFINPLYVFDSTEEAKEFFDQVETFKNNLYKDYAEFNAREKKTKTIQKVKELLEKCNNVSKDDDNYFSTKFVFACELFDYMILGDGFGLILEHPQLKLTIINKLQEIINYLNIKGDSDKMNIIIKYNKVLHFLLDSKVSFAPFFV